MNEQHIKICFNVGGYVKQDIVITDEDYSPERVIAGLQDGTIATTIETGGDVVDMSNSAWKTIGTVIDIEAETEYSDFDMDSEYTLPVKNKDTFDRTHMALAAAVGEVITDTDIAVNDVLDKLVKAGGNLAAEATDLPIVEHMQFMSGTELAREIGYLQKGFESLMSIAYDAGKAGKEVI